MVRLDQLEALVHHGRRVDRDLGAHPPIRMRHRLLGGNVAHGIEAELAERPAARRQDDVVDGVALALVEHLVDSVVLAVDRQQASRSGARPRPMTRLPAHTSTSLLASATMAPRRIAASVGARPAAPTIAAITIRLAAPPPRSPLAVRPRPRRRCPRAPPSAPCNGWDRRPPRAVHRAAAPAPPGFSASRCAVSASTTKSSRWRSMRSRRVAADRAGAAENRNAALLPCGVRVHCPILIARSLIARLRRCRRRQG